MSTAVVATILRIAFGIELVRRSPRPRRARIAKPRHHLG